MSQNNPRILSVDAFRGFALAGIVLVHFVEQFIAGQIPEDEMAHFLHGIFFPHPAAPKHKMLRSKLPCDDTIQSLETHLDEPQ